MSASLLSPSLPTESVAPELSRSFDKLKRKLTGSRRFSRDADQAVGELIRRAQEHWPAAAEAQVDTATGLIGMCLAWNKLSDAPSRRLLRLTEESLLRLSPALEALAADAADDSTGDESSDEDATKKLASELYEVWTHCDLLPRRVVESILLASAGEPLLPALRDLVGREAMRLGQDMSGLLAQASTGASGSPSLAREHALFHARLRSRLGNLERAIDILDSEPASDPAVVLAYGDVYAEHGEFEHAITRLRRSLPVTSGDERWRVRERLVELLHEDGQRDTAHQEQLNLAIESNDMTYWFALCEELGDEPAELKALHDGLKERAPGLYVETLMQHGDYDAVAKASRAKTFSFEQLWRFADFLAANRSSDAARLYERAIQLQGMVAQSKAQCADLGARMRRVLPFFEEMKRPLKLRRIARELVSRNRHNKPLRRELESVLGAKLGR